MTAIPANKISFARPRGAAVSRHGRTVFRCWRRRNWNETTRGAPASSIRCSIGDASLAMLRRRCEKRLVILLDLRVGGKNRSGDRRDRLDVALGLGRRQRDQLAAVLAPDLLGALDVG